MSLTCTSVPMVGGAIVDYVVLDVSRFSAAARTRGARQRLPRDFQLAALVDRFRSH